MDPMGYATIGRFCGMILHEKSEGCVGNSLHGCWNRVVFLSAGKPCLQAHQSPTTQEKDPNFAAFPTFPVDLWLQCMSFDVICKYLHLCLLNGQDSRVAKWKLAFRQVQQTSNPKRNCHWGPLLQGHLFWCAAVPVAHFGASAHCLWIMEIDFLCLQWCWR